MLPSEMALSLSAADGSQFHSCDVSVSKSVEEAFHGGYRGTYSVVHVTHFLFFNERSNFKGKNL